jgi:L-fuculose-phosphate aldolase
MSQRAGFDPGPRRKRAVQLLGAAEQLAVRGVLSSSLHGNLSARVPETGQVVLTARSSLDRLRLRNLAILDVEGRLSEGFIDPSTHEIVQLHCAVYRQRPGVGAIIHTHSPHATAFAIAGRTIEP